MLRTIFVLAALFTALPVARAQQVSVTPLEGKIRVKVDGQLFTEYVYSGCENPYLFPVIGPHGIEMTRNYPMRDVPGEDHDHPHHTSIWFAHDGINGVDFWRSTKPGHGRVEQDQLVRTESGQRKGLLETTNRWVGPDGIIHCRDTRTICFLVLPNGRAIDWQISLIASAGDVTIQDTEEGTMGIRTHPNLRLENSDVVNTANGQAINSNGVTGKQVWGKRAEWIDYWGSIEGHTVGIALFDHPQNPRHPTWYHARPYGLFTANPFGIHDFEKKPPGTGDMHIAKGDQVTFRYRFFFHEGNAESGRIKNYYEAYREN